MNMASYNAIEATRQFLNKERIAAIIIPTNDPHFGEYTQSYYKVREYLSGFTGSAGVLVISEKSAALWTDSRYFVQAKEQLNGRGIELMKLKMPNTPTVSEWIKAQINENLNGNKKIAIDKSLYSYKEYLQLQQDLSPYEIQPIDDPFSSASDPIWHNRPALVFNPIEFMPIERSGENSISKHLRVTEKLKATLKEKFNINKDYIYIVTECDDVAWLCNIRGKDIEYNPLVESYAIITNNGIILFANNKAVEASIINGKPIREILLEQKIEIQEYTTFEHYLNNLGTTAQVIYPPDTITVRDYFAINKPGAILIEDRVKGGIIADLKSIKNQTEINGFRESFLLDGVAWCRLLKYINDLPDKLDEYSIGKKLIEFRRQSKDLYVDESFEPIVAFGAAGALPHYSATKDKHNTIIGNNLLLMDTGAQYLMGTTDTTRTIAIGELNEEQKKFYTLVLKGMIQLSCAKFPEGTRGSQLDILARGPLFNQGAMYFHGTCHGIGHYLCVHEGPQSVRMEENQVSIKPGMVISNEPAIYFDKKWGIRIENVLLVKDWKETEFNKFYEFETLTLVPIEVKNINWDLLTSEEVKWIKDYNHNVYKRLAPLLEKREQKWLKEYISMQ